jgi:hypothetical protein
MPLREGGNMLWSVTEGPMLKADPFARLKNSPLFKESQKAYEAGWSTHDVIADPKFKSLSDDPKKPVDLQLTKGSPAIDKGLQVPANWPDPLRELDQAQPDIGAVPFGVKPWGVGIEGRIPVFGGPEEKTKAH